MYKYILQSQQDETSNILYGNLLFISVGSGSAIKALWRTCAEAGCSCCKRKYFMIVSSFFVIAGFNPDEAAFLLWLVFVFSLSNTYFDLKIQWRSKSIYVMIASSFSTRQSIYVTLASMTRDTSEWFFTVSTVPVRFAQPIPQRKTLLSLSLLRIRPIC